MRWTSPAGLGLLAAFMLPVLVLAVVSVISVRERQETRQVLVEERYANAADLITTKLDEQLELWERELLDMLDDADWSDDSLLATLHEAEHKFPSLRPMLVLSPEGKIAYPGRLRSGSSVMNLAPRSLERVGPDGYQFSWLMQLGHEAELADTDADHLDRAARAYRRALRVAETVHERIDALAGLGRAQRKAREWQDAVATYERIAELSNPFDPATSRWGIVARLQAAAAWQQAGEASLACDTKFKALEHLVAHRSHLDPDVYEFYRAEAERAIAEHELEPDQVEELARIRAADEQRQSVDEALTLLTRQAPQLVGMKSEGWKSLALVAANVSTGDSSDTAAPEVEWTSQHPSLQSDTTGSTVVSERGGTDWRIVRRWRRETIIDIMAGLMKSERAMPAGIALIDPGDTIAYKSRGSSEPKEMVAARVPLVALPGWRIVAYPPRGSLNAEAQRDVFDFTLTLAAAFLAVVGGLVVATRTLSKEVALARTRSDFVSNVSHELKTPLSLIRMFAENLRAGWVPEEKKPEYYQVMLGESERLSGVIDNVLDFSRIESGRRAFRFEEVDVVDVVTDIIDRYRYSFETAGIALAFDIPAHAVNARIDREGIAQVVVNLLSNAAKYIGEGTKRVDVRLLVDEDDVHIVVADTGVGMSADAVQEIFAPFCRIDNPEVHSVAGSGIGLTIARHIVEAHDGQIDVESTPGKGSTFIVSLPRRNEPDSEEADRD